MSFQADQRDEGSSKAETNLRERYEPSVTVDEQVELLSLIGDIALKDGEPAVHAHAVIWKKVGSELSLLL